MAGIDFGNQTSAIALIKKGGIEVVANEASNRLNPSLVGYGPQERFAGEAAQTQYTTNIKNTVSQIKRFLGKKYSEVKDEIPKVPFTVKELPNDQIGLEVNYEGNPIVLSPTKVAATLFVKIKQVAEQNMGGARLTDFVCSVPAYYNDAQRQALYNATEIAGLNCTRLLNETTATALIYGFYKLDLHEENPTHVMFIDVGHSATTCSIVAFTKGGLKVLNTTFDENLGGRDFDEVLVNHFAAEFKQKYKIDVLSNPKALLRLRVSCEKLKQVLSSGVPKAPLNIESLMNDVDVSSSFEKKDFEAMIAPFLQRAAAVVQRALTESNIAAETLSSVEIVGASKRMPSLQAALKEVLKRDLSQTLNDVESVARGCALQAAITSPTHKVRKFDVIDFHSYPITVSYTVASAMKDANSQNPQENLYPRGSAFPALRKMTVRLAEPLEVTCTYPGASTPLVAYRLPTVPQDSGSAQAKKHIELRFRLNHSDIFSLDSASLLISEESAETAAADATPAATAENGAASSPATAAPPAKKKKLLKTDLPFEIVSSVSQMTKADVTQAFEDECRMQAADRLAYETAEGRNALESYVLNMRSKIGDELSSYSTEEEKEQFNKLSFEIEDWLYEDGRNAKKSEYNDKLESLKKIGNVVSNRRAEENQREENVAELQKTIEQYRSALNEPKYDHIDQEEKAKIQFELEKVEQSVKNDVGKQNLLPKTAPLGILAADILTKKKELEKLANSILSKPKPAPPKVETPKTETAAPEAQPQANTADDASMKDDSTASPAPTAASDEHMKDAEVD